ncbi:terpene synthase 6, chloroplastic isoform X2 [Impatiens glandulifera]|uniref:terpene synthase 6, chloroplastic isoform X2 n=1 Tax=Impatiens glandulifera TaxID=253017 RepID=UPI001FB11B4B|nr:terpene synthase 6, chloroplastic isoform X2 [Impatiens glandulifera]
MIAHLLTMSVPNNSLFHRDISRSSITASLRQQVESSSDFHTTIQTFDGSKERIKKLFNKIEISASPYDTAWVAMVPSPYSSQLPCFPACIDWLVDNQLIDGSWGPVHNGPVVIKEALSSTLACVLALKQWGIGEEHVNKGLQFIESNITSAIDENTNSPVGFEIIFPHMMRRVEELGLNVPIDPKDLNAMLSKRELELKRCFSEGRRSYLAFISEGIEGGSNDWKMVMKYQRKNGSLFNSPSTTAAAFMHLKDAGCLNYLFSVTKKFGSAVAYPLDIYVRLSMVDQLTRLGIERHFTDEIRSVLDETYGCWLLNDEQIFHDIATSSMAFRLLRLNGYNVSSDPLTRTSSTEDDFIFPEQHSKTIDDALESYKALQFTLEKHHLRSSEFLKEKLSSCLINKNDLNKYITQEVDDALKFPFHADLVRIANRRNIEQYKINRSMLLKSSYSSPNIGNEDFLKVAVEDFNTCQSIHREELEKLERWTVEYKLDKLQFARQKSAYCYFSAAASLPSPEHSDARVSWAKNGVLTTVVDDFFDIGGSPEELKNLIQLVEKWDVDLETDCISENVQILFSALHDTICGIGTNALAFQGRSVTSHIIEIWLDLLNSMLQEAIWTRDKTVPTMDDYLSNAFVSFALGPIVLPALYLVGSKLSDEAARSFEIQSLYKFMSTSGRILNDIRGFERESKEGKLNAVSLYMIERNGEVTEEEAIENLMGIVSQQRRELLGLVLKVEEDGAVPRAIKEVFWKMVQVLHIFYAKDDGFTSNAMVNAVKSIIYQPISHPQIK